MHKNQIWFPEVKPELLFFICVCSDSHMRGVDFLRYTSASHKWYSWGVCVRPCVLVCVCVSERAFRECLTFSQWAGFTQRLCHTSPILLIAGQRLHPDRQMLLLDLCVIKHLFWKISRGILESNRHTPLLKSDPFESYYFLIHLIFFCCFWKGCSVLLKASGGIVSLFLHIL